MQHPEEHASRAEIMDRGPAQMIVGADPRQRAETRLSVFSLNDFAHLIACSNQVVPITLRVDIMTQIHEGSVIELHDLDGNILSQEESTTMRSLPAVDGGLAAWRLLVAALVFVAVLWGQ